MVGSQLTRGDEEHRSRVDAPHRSDHARVLPLESAFNVRDLGHLPVRGRRSTRCGLLFRADSLDWLTPADRHLLFDELGVGTVIDLRTRREAGGDGLSDARLFPAVRVLSIPLIPDEEMEVEPFPVGDPSAVAEHYLGYLDGGGREARSVVEAIAESIDSGTPVLFHCAAGRDRTGVVAALVLLIVGVTRQGVVADYLESNRFAAELTRRLSRNPMYRHHERLDTSATKVDRRAIVRFIQLLDERYGGARKWAHSVGIPDDTIEALTKNLVGDQDRFADRA
jgi:protein-tyrosine phosphatase